MNLEITQKKTPKWFDCSRVSLFIRYAVEHKRLKLWAVADWPPSIKIGVNSLSLSSLRYAPFSFLNGGFARDSLLTSMPGQRHLIAVPRDMLKSSAPFGYMRTIFLRRRLLFVSFSRGWRWCECMMTFPYGTRGNGYCSIEKDFLAATAHLFEPV